jgi:arabinoxylan arabinofuranohydrolase
MKLALSTFLLFVALVASAQTVPARRGNVNTKPYPYNNPVIRHMYTADAAPRVYPDGRVWMVTSVDHEEGGGYSTMHKYHTFSSADMVNWTDHGEVLNVWDVLGSDTEPEGEDWALWAPDMVYHNGLYYLYFPVRILYTQHGYEEASRKTQSYIAVAVSESPDKKFRVVNPKIEGTRGIDPAVFIDDDGEKYLYFGSHWGAKLKDNMIELDGEVIRMEIGVNNFMEAIWMHKHNDKYYVSYHTNYGKPIDPENPDDPKRGKSQLDYVVGDNPLGPFTYGGVMNYELGVNVNEGPDYPGKNFVPWRVFQSNHGGIVEFHGQDYLFYHTSALSSWRQDEFKGPGTWTQRSVCIDYLNYNADDSIIPVQQTLGSVPPVVVNQPFSISLACRKPKLSKSVKLVNNEFEVSGNGEIAYKKVNLGTGYYYFEIDLEKCTGKARIEVRKGSSNGQLMGTINLNEESIFVNQGKARIALRNASGSTDVYLLVISDNNDNLRFSNPAFFAGSPKKQNDR